MKKSWYKKKSSLHGSGLFANRDIKKAEQVIQYIGDKVTKKEGDKRADKQIKKAQNNKKNGMVYVFELNKKYIPKYLSIIRCIDKRFETGEIYIKWDDAIEADWLILIYIKNNSPDEGIVIEDKTNPEKNISHEFKNNEIFKASDTMVDALTQLIARKRAKNIN